MVGLSIVVLAILAFSGTAAGAPSYGGGTIAARGALDCNGFSTAQQTIKTTGACTDIRGFPGVTNANNQNSRFFDNGHYIGHDEPTLTFNSITPGTGNNVMWKETLPQDPAAAPTVETPGSDVTHWAELSVAPWFGMALCNPRSYPIRPCAPKSDNNRAHGNFPGGGSSFLEVQFYPPGEGPFVDNISCDNSHWCASLHINDLECTQGFDSCNPQCEEPTNFAFIQKDGTPTGPPNPQEATDASYTPNDQTLLMNPGDKLRVHIWDAPVVGGDGNALEVKVDDLTTHETGYMQASAVNGYAATGIGDCAGHPFNYEPEYRTAGKGNIVPWAALRGDIMTEYEIGHFTPCASLSDNFGSFYGTCNGPYEAADDSTTDEGAFGDAPCYLAGDTHGGTSDPNIVTGCLDFNAGGDIDFDGTSYWPDWPTGTSPTDTNPGSFVQSAPNSNGNLYQQSFFQTDVALSEYDCQNNSPAGCTVPPEGPGNFYPYFSTIKNGKKCSILFGNVAAGPGVNTYGQDAQYGTDQVGTVGYDEFMGKSHKAVC